MQDSLNKHRGNANENGADIENEMRTTGSGSTTLNSQRPSVQSSSNPYDLYGPSNDEDKDNINNVSPRPLTDEDDRNDGFVAVAAASGAGAA